MSFDLDKMQAVIELGEVIRLQNDALDRLVAFRKARPNMMMPNLARMVEENLKENLQVLYKELNNMHRPPEQQTRYICRECKMAYLSPLPGGICDECRARKGSSQPRAYVSHVATGSEDADDVAGDENAEAHDAAAGQELIASSTGEEQAVADAYESALGAQDETEVERLMAEPKAINPPSDDTELYMADGEEVSEDMATLPLEDEEPGEIVETVIDQDVSPVMDSDSGDENETDENKI